MSNVPRIVVLFMADMGMMAFLAILFGETHRYAMNERLRDIVLGVLFGLCGTYSIVSHLTLGGPGSVHLANIFTAFAAAFLRAPGAFAALAICLGSNWLIQQHWAAANSVDIIASALVGWAWSATRDKKSSSTPESVFLLGVGIGATFLPIAAAFGVEVAADRVVHAVPAAVVAVIATGLLGGFIERERRMISIEKMLRLDAATDPLTGLSNRREFEGAFSAMTRRSLQGSLVLIDLDHFKLVNDMHGHAAGDAVLKEVALALKRMVRSDDLVVRIGGEEFAVLLTGQSPMEALVAAERWRQDIAARSIVHGGISISISISLGICGWEGRPSLVDVVQAADGALYSAKRNGRNQSAVAASLLMSQ